MATASNSLNQNMFIDSYPFSYDKDTTHGWVIRSSNGNIMLFPNPRRDMYEREAKALCEALNMYNRARLLDGRE